MHETNEMVHMVCSSPLHLCSKGECLVWKDFEVTYKQRDYHSSYRLVFPELFLHITFSHQSDALAVFSKNAKHSASYTADAQKYLLNTSLAGTPGIQ